MRKVAISIAILIVLVMGALVLAPRFVDLDRYRADAAAEASRRLDGREVTIAGPLGLALLPSPSIVIRDVRVANPPGGSTPDMIRVREVDATLAFWPLLTGRYEVTSLRLIEPSVTLEHLADGRANWEPGETLTSNLPAAPAAGADAAPNARPNSGGGGALRIDRLAIEGGTLSYRSGNALHVVEHIAATLSGDAVSGPFHTEGSLTTAGTSVAITADIGRFRTARVPIALSLALRSAATLSFDGAWEEEGVRPRLAGKIAAKADDPNTVAALLGIGSLPAVANRRLAAASDVAVSGETMEFTHIAIDLGDVHGEGALTATLGATPSVDATLSANSLDLDAWFAERAADNPSTSGASSTASDAASAKLPAAAALGPVNFAWPRGVAASLKLDIDGIVWRKGVIRQARLEAALAGGELAVKRLSALLPGVSDVSVAGTVDTIAALPRFSGTVEAATDNLRELLGWLGVTANGVPADRLRRATIASKISVDGEIAEARDAALTLDAARITGAATLALRHRLAFGARLAIDQLNLDAYLPPDAPVQTASSAAASPPPPTAPWSAPSLGDTLGSFDGNLDAAIDTVIWRGQPARHVHFLGTLANRDFTVRELSVGDLGGASGKLSGFVQGGGGAGKSVMAFDMRGPELGRVLRVAAPGLVSGENYGAFSLGGEVQGEGDHLALDGDLEALGGKLQMTGDLPRGERWSVTVALDNPSFNRVIHMASPAYRPQGGELGAVKLRGMLERNGKTAFLKGLALDIGGMNVGGELSLDFEGRPALGAILTIGDVALDKFMPARQTAALDRSDRLRHGVMLAQTAPAQLHSPTGGAWSRAPLDLGFLKVLDADVALTGKSLAWGRWRLTEPTAKLELRNAALKLQQLDGTLFGGAIAASGTIDVSTIPGLDLKLAVTKADLKQALAEAGVSLIDGNFDVDATLAASGADPTDLIAHLNGKAALHGRDGTINGINLPALSQTVNQLNRAGDLLALLRSGSGGSTRFSALDGTFKVANGVAVSNDLHLVADSGEGKGTAILDFPSWTIASRTEFRLTDVTDAPPLGVVLDGPLDQPRKIFDINAMEKFLLARLAARAGRPGAVPADPGSDAPPTATPPTKPSQLLRDWLNESKPRQ